MNKNAYSGYGLALLAGGVVAIWLGLSPSFLLILLVCPLMMFFMMRGMHGGQEGDSTSPDEGTRSGQNTGPGRHESL